jgi:thiol:disulfide interchange protein
MRNTAIASDAPPFMGASLRVRGRPAATQALAILAQLGAGHGAALPEADVVPQGGACLPSANPARAWMVNLQNVMAFPMFATVVCILID